MKNNNRPNRIVPFLWSLSILLIFGACSAVENESDMPGEPVDLQAPSLLQPIENSLVDASDMFTARDLTQIPDLDEAVALSLEDGGDTVIDRGGVYILSGDYREVTVVVDADNDEAKVQLVLDSLTITNTNAPAIYVKSADKVFITTLETDNTLSVSEAIAADGDTNLDAVIFSRSDLILNGSGNLTVLSVEENGISSKDNLKITGGSLEINSKNDGLEANDSIRIAGGVIAINAGADGLHSENNDDSSLGNIYVYKGELNITAGDDAIRGNSFIQIDGGRITVADSYEGLEATHIRISGGSLDIYSSDDGINVAAKTPSEVLLEIYDGTIGVEVGSGDTDAIDANGDMAIYGGTINVTTPRSAFDVDGTLDFAGGTVTINGVTVDEIPVTRGGGRR